MAPSSTPQAALARGPLCDWHRERGATLQTVGGWQVATRYPREPQTGANALADLSHWPTFELNGPATGEQLRTLTGQDVPLRRILAEGARQTYRLTPTRAIVFGQAEIPPGAIDVTGGWATLALFGSDREAILAKLTAVNLREQTSPAYGCCQGPVFGVNTLFGRFPTHFLLHVCPDSAQFFWELLLDAGIEFGLAPVGLERYREWLAQG